MGRWGPWVQIPPLRPIFPEDDPPASKSTAAPAEVDVSVRQADVPQTIQTARLFLRRFRAQDAADFHAILSDPEAMRYWSTPPHRALSETIDWVGRTVAAVAAGEADDFIVLNEGRIVGNAGLWHGSELGMIFDRRCWGQGFAGEALRAVIERAFGLGHASIKADVDPRNEKSLHLMLKLGFVETHRAERTMQIGEAWVDSVYLELVPAGFRR
jgi:ribosomal-protein-alanine N-acetyltransferase